MQSLIHIKFYNYNTFLVSLFQRSFPSSKNIYENVLVTTGNITIIAAMAIALVLYLNKLTISNFKKSIDFRLYSFRKINEIILIEYYFVNKSVIVDQT